MPRDISMIKNLIAKFAGLPTLPAPRAIRPPSETYSPLITNTPAPTPAPAMPAPAAQPNIIQQNTDQAMLSKMKRFIQENYDPSDPMAEQELMMVTPPAWKSQYKHLWEQALKQYHANMPAPQMVPESNFPNMSDTDLASVILQHGKMLSFEELPPNIAENEYNRERYYDMASKYFGEQQSAQAADAPAQQFTNPLAQEFYQSYLDSSSPGSEEFHSLLQRAGSNFYGDQTGAEIDRLDQALTRIPEGFAGGKGRGKRNYDPVAGFFVSRGRRYLRPFKSEIEGMSPPQMAQYLMQNHQSELDEMFNDLMVGQSVDVFEYVSDLLKMKVDRGGAGASSLIDQESGGVRDMGENLGVSNMNKAPGMDEGSTEEEKGLLWSAFRSIPKAVDQTGLQLRNILKQKAEVAKDPDEKARLNNLANYTAAYLGAMDKSFSELHKTLSSGNAIDPKMLKELEGRGVRVVPVKTPSGNRIEISLDGVTDPKDAIDTMNFADLVPPRQMINHLITYLDQMHAQDGNADPQGMTNQILSPGKAYGPLDRNLLATDPKYATEVKKRIWTSTQFIPAYIGNEVMQGLENGQFSPQAVRAMFKMLRPHSDSSKWGKMLSRHNKEGDQARRSFMTQKMPEVDISRMSPDELYTYFVNNARSMFQQLPSDKRRPSAEYLGRFYDYGRQPSGFTGWPQAATAGGIYENAIIRISQLIDLRNSMMKFASVSHIDSMIAAIREDAIQRVNSVWKK